MPSAGTPRLFPVTAVFVLVVPTLLLQAQYIPSGELSAPHGSYVLFGQQLVMVCELNKSLPYNASDLYIEKGDGEFNGTTRIVDQFTVVMNTTVTSMNYAGSYFCWAGAEEFLGQQDIQVEYYPKVVNRVSCVYYNWDGWLNISWSLGVPYVQPSDIAVTLHHNCGSKCLNQTRTSCFIPSCLPYDIKVRVDVMNTRANVSLQGEMKRLILSNFVKPAPCTVHWELSNTTSKTFTLLWSHNMPVRRKVYRLRYRQGTQQQWKMVYINRTLDQEGIEMRYQAYTVSNLKPNRKYSIRLDTRPLADNSNERTGYWSDEMQGNLTTLQAVPTTGPLVTSGSFSQKMCSVHSTREVPVYWKPPSEDNQNGVIRRYKLYDGVGEHTVNGSVFTYILHPPCQKDVLLHVCAATDIGWSNNCSQIYIPSPKNDVRLFEDFYMLMYETELRAVWERRGGEGVEFFVYWCQGDSLRQMCTGEISWQHVPENDVNVSLSNRITRQANMFGISASKAGVSNGIHWTKCIVQDIAPTVSPTTLKVEQTPELSSRHVRWENTRCMNNDQALVKAYRLIVRVVTNKKGVTYLNKTFSLRVNDFTVTGLSLHSNYSFQLQALSNVGEGPLSAPLYSFIQPPHSDSSYTFILIAIVCLVLVAICLIGVFKRQKISSCIKKKEPILLPKTTSPQTSPSHVLLSGTAILTARSALDMSTVTTHESVLWSEADSSSRFNSDRSSGSSSSPHTLDNSEHVESAGQVTTGQMTLTEPKEYSLFALSPTDEILNPGTDSQSNLPVSRTVNENNCSVMHLQYVSPPLTTASVPTTICSDSNTSYSPNPSTDSANSYVKVSEKHSTDVGNSLENTPSPAILQLEITDPVQDMKYTGNQDYVSVPDINTIKL